FKSTSCLHVLFQSAVTHHRRLIRRLIHKRLMTPTPDPFTSTHASSLSHTHTHTLYLSLSLSLSHTHSISLSLSLSHTHHLSLSPPPQPPRWAQRGGPACWPKSRGVVGLHFI